MVDASVARLWEAALGLPRPGCDWEDRPQFGPPASANEVAAFEQAAGFPLPADVRAFLERTGVVVGMSVHNGYWLGGVDRLAGILAGDDRPTSLAGEPLVPVATDGGGNVFWVSATGGVWRWFHETGVMTPVADSFTAFVTRVAADWEAYVAETPDWRFLV